MSHLWSRKFELRVVARPQEAPTEAPSIFKLCKPGRKGLSSRVRRPPWPSHQRRGTSWAAVRARRSRTPAAATAEEPGGEGSAGGAGRPGPQWTRHPRTAPGARQMPPARLGPGPQGSLLRRSRCMEAGRPKTGTRLQSLLQMKVGKRKLLTRSIPPAAARFSFKFSSVLIDLSVLSPSYDAHTSMSTLSLHAIGSIVPFASKLRTNQDVKSCALSLSGADCHLSPTQTT